MGRISIFVLLILFFSLGLLGAQEESQILDFNMAGFTKEGDKSWEIKGKSADIFSEEVILKDLEANFYEKEKVTLTSKEGLFDRKKNLIHLEKDVNLITETGSSLKTDSLDYNENEGILISKDPVDIQRENTSLKGMGLEANLDLKTAQLSKDIVLEINPVRNTQNSIEKDKISNGVNRSNPEERKIQITCGGPLEIGYEKGIAYFFNNVKVEDVEGDIISDKMEVYFDISDKEKDLGGWKINRIRAIGNVKIIRGKNISYSQEAIYDTKEKKVTLLGEPKLIIYSEEKISLP